MLIIPSVILAITCDEDREYMENLYRVHHEKMLHIAKRYCYDKNELEDVISDSCIRLINNLKSIRSMDDTHLECYIYFVVRRMAYDYNRKRKRLNEHFFHIAEENADNYIDGSDVENQIMLKDEIEYVLQLIKSLPTKEQLVLMLKFSMGLSDAEIAESVGLAQSSVRKYVERGRTHIKDRLYHK